MLGFHLERRQGVVPDVKLPVAPEEVQQIVQEAVGTVKKKVERLVRKSLRCHLPRDSRNGSTKWKQLFENNLGLRRTIWKAAAKRYPKSFKMEPQELGEQVSRSAINRLSHHGLLLAWTRFVCKDGFLEANRHLTYQQLKHLRPLYKREIVDECWPTFDAGVPVFSTYASTKQIASKKNIGGRARQPERSQVSIGKGKIDVCALAWRVANKGKLIPVGRQLELSHTMYIVAGRGVTERNVVATILEDGKTNRSRIACTERMQALFEEEDEEGFDRSLYGWNAQRFDGCSHKVPCTYWAPRFCSDAA